MTENDDELPRQYELFFSEGAEAEIEEAFDYFFVKDPHFAFEWMRGLREATDSLTEMPRRYALDMSLSEESEAEIRRLLYWCGSVAYRVTYAIIETDESNPLVRILRVRHAARGE